MNRTNVDQKNAYFYKILSNITLTQLTTSLHTCKYGADGTEIDVMIELPVTRQVNG